MNMLLSVHWHVNPILFHIGSLEIRWYGLLFVSGFVIGWYLFKWFFTREKLDTKLMDPLLYTLLIATIVTIQFGLLRTKEEKEFAKQQEAAAAAAGQ